MVDRENITDFFRSKKSALRNALTQARGAKSWPSCALDPESPDHRFTR